MTKQTNRRGVTLALEQTSEALRGTFGALQAVIEAAPIGEPVDVEGLLTVVLLTLERQVGSQLGDEGRGREACRLGMLEFIAAAARGGR